MFYMSFEGSTHKHAQSFIMMILLCGIWGVNGLYDTKQYKAGINLVSNPDFALPGIPAGRVNLIILGGF